MSVPTIHNSRRSREPQPPGTTASLILCALERTFIIQQTHRRTTLFPVFFYLFLSSKCQYSHKTNQRAPYHRILLRDKMALQLRKKSIFQITSESKGGNGMTRITEILRTALRAYLSYSIMFCTARRTELSLILIRTIRTYNIILSVILLTTSRTSNHIRCSSFRFSNAKKRWYSCFRIYEGKLYK